MPSSEFYEIDMTKIRETMPKDSIVTIRRYENMEYAKFIIECTPSDVMSSDEVKMAKGWQKQALGSCVVMIEDHEDSQGWTIYIDGESFGFKITPEDASDLELPDIMQMQSGLLGSILSTLFSGLTDESGDEPKEKEIPHHLKTGVDYRGPEPSLN